MKKSILLILVLVLGPAAICPAIQDTWTQKADMSTARAYFSTSVVNNKIYAIGGEYSVPAVNHLHLFLPAGQANRLS